MSRFSRRDLLRAAGAVGAGASAVLIAGPAYAGTGDRRDRAQDQKSFFVATDGKDSNRGTQAAPFATPEKARDAIRAWRQGAPGRATAPVTVFLRGGTYRRTRSFTLEAQDSGAPGRPVTYAAYNGEQVRLVGGVDLPATGFGAVSDEAIRNRLPAGSRDIVREFDLKALGITDYGQIVQTGYGLPRTVTPPELFFNSKAMTLARYPSTGFLAVGQVIDPGGNPRSVLGDPDKMAAEFAKGATFKYTDPRPSTWTDTSDVWMQGYWFYEWADGNLQIKAIDPAAQTVSTKTASMYSVKAGQRYYYYNVLEELDSPGEWYLDRATGKLYLYPPSDLTGASVQLSLLADPMAVLNGCSNVTFSNLTLEGSRGDGIVITDGTSNTVTDCTLRLLGGRAVTIGDASVSAGPRGGSGNEVRGCHIQATGQGGIALAGGDRATLTPARNRAVGNEIHDYSRLQLTYSPAVELAGVGNHVANNHIYDAPHVAILFRGNDHVIEYNEINDVVKETNDAGAIYAGREWTGRGTVIRYNFLHDIVGSGGSHFASGVYLDDCFCGTTVFGNIFYKVDTAFQIGGGRDNNISNNIMLSSGRSVTLDERGLNWAAQNVAPGGAWGMYDLLAAVPYQKEPWRSRYPNLVNIADDQPAYPKYNVVEYNALCTVAALDIAPSARTYGTVDRNLTLTADPGVVTVVDGKPTLGNDDLIAAQLPGYQRIPMNRIGLS
ncbi:right-handed parallel beta-helix repeat-containing protein [Streptomyces sp. NBC_00825]|uniref:right-handed parallel beta-helix repeat-containing protein n=1 Tax=unclassified Streptomyces TaxID=2593676 RepID=UPI002ECFB86D|nr:right-handed parallel beta-helix repeat-containing protein [Streptomyces sp. NBC_00826]WTH95276.1 right-handed parallel beta-helix repeat-containing protein [Streptomyces sp. NBC_00825]WTI04010.1 right-handed parallel beta-helix repeat-containing protein [Streptomyces sp. NBC_00822]